MINIIVFSNKFVQVESKEHNIVFKQDMINFLKDLIDKIEYGGERLCLESAEIIDNKISTPKVEFTEVQRWGFDKAKLTETGWIVNPKPEEMK